MPPGSLNQAQGLATFLEKQPWPGFLAITLLALFGVFVLLLREKGAHQKTLREVLPLMTTTTAAWNRQLEEREEEKRDMARERADIARERAAFALEREKWVTSNRNAAPSVTLVEKPPVVG